VGRCSTRALSPTTIDGSAMDISKIIYGTSKLGNLYEDIGEDRKRDIIATVIASSDEPIIFDTAGKYGAGLALEVLGNTLRRLSVDPSQIVISNKLGWKQTPLPDHREPTFEPGAWVNIHHDCVLDISYDGIMECFHQGNNLLGEGFSTNMVSVHDPDEYLIQANGNAEEEVARMTNIKEAYRALHDLKSAGLVSSVGIGCKDPTVVDRITDLIELDWVMMACSVTPMAHSDCTLALLRKLRAKEIPVINSAVFHGGFLVGEQYCDYRRIDPVNPADTTLLQWREKYTSLCQSVGISPAFAAIQFSFLFDGICSVALNADSVEHAIANHRMVFMVDEYGGEEVKERLHNLWSLLVQENMMSASIIRKSSQF
jgi:D-threo-aldose 1-dehydrogenase